ncbi:MAG TPA: hypothetical protein PL009_13185 [Flavipsychrobacter sp.]|nr:hypothetical protein [Flavipsychrobacter sp.]
MASIQGYDSTELDGMVVKQYAQNTNFSASVSEVVFTTTRIWQKGYTIFSTDAPYDYLIEIPKLNKTHRVTNISFADDNYKEFFLQGEAEACSNGGSYQVDGKQHSFNKSDYCYPVGRDCHSVIYIQRSE